MCMQCMTESYLICEFLKGWYLFRAVKSYTDETYIWNSWNTGELALIRINDPDYIITINPIKDPTFYMSELEEDEYYLDVDPNMDGFEKISQHADILRKCLISDPETGYALISSAIDAGFSSMEIGFEFWLLQKLAEAVEYYDLKRDRTTDEEISDVEYRVIRNKLYEGEYHVDN